MSTRSYMMPWVSLQHVAVYLRHELDARLRESIGVSVMERDLLGHISRCGEDWKMKDFAAALCVSKTAVTKLVNRLNANGLVERVPSSVDGRVTHIELTEAGRDILTESSAIVAPFVRSEFADALNASEMEALGKALSRVLASHGRWDGQLEYLAEN